MEALNVFNISFNNNQNNFLSLAYWCRKKAAIFDKSDANGKSIFSFKKNAFVDRAFTLMLVYRKQFLQMQEFSEILQYLVATYYIDIKAGNFNYYISKVLKNKLLDCLNDSVQ